MTNRNRAKMVVHSMAAAGMPTVAALPVGADATALRAEEVAMIIAIGKVYGQKLTKAAASGILASGFAQMVGEKIAIGLLEMSNATGPLAFVIKSGVAVSLIEMVGMCAIDFFEELAEKENGYGSNAA